MKRTVKSATKSFADGKVIISTHLEEELTPQDIAASIQNLDRQMSSIVEQMAAAKARYEAFKAEKEGLQDALSKLTTDTDLPTI